MKPENTKKLFDLGTIFIYIIIIAISIIYKLYEINYIITPMAFLGFVFAMSSNYLNNRKE